MVNQKSDAERRSENVALRLTIDELARVRRVAAALDARTPGLGVTAAAATRTAMLRGLDVLEAELGLVKARRR